MLLVQSVDSSAARVASGLDMRRVELVAAYQDHLQGMNSPLLGESTTLIQVMAHLVEALDEVIDSLRGDTQSAHRTVLAGSIGASRAAGGVHPAESLQAAMAAFDVFMTAVAESLNVAEDSAVLSVAITVNQVIMSRIESAISTYCDFLTDKIYCAHIEARHHLARELHDRVGTEVSVAHRQLELFALSRSEDPIAAENNIESAQIALVQAMDNVRQLALNLRVSEAGDGLEKTLRSYLESESAEGVAAEVIVTGDETWMPPHVRTEIALVAREALRNALYHGHPRTVVARVSLAPHEVRGAVRDDGIGFVPHESPAAGSGLLSMQERVALLGGILRISSRVGHGTVVEFRVPFGQGDDDR
jgi:signal transduction histidine kinase